MSRHGIYDLKDGFIPDDDCPQKNPQTNADRIRAMTDEELAEFIGLIRRPVNLMYCDFDNCPSNCDECRLEWLKREAKDERQ